MKEHLRQHGIGYLVAVGATAAAVLLRWLLDPLMGDTLPLITLLGAVAVAVWLGGYRPALLVVALGYLACDYLFIEPRGSFGFNEVHNLVGLLAYLVTCSIIIGFGEAMRISRRRIEELLQQQGRAAEVLAEQKERLRTTLASIGDAVIATDTEGRITVMNGVAEDLTGWKTLEAMGQPLDSVLRIVNEQSRQPVENPVQKVVTLGQVVGLANHTALIAKDGTERPIDARAAPIRCKEGNEAEAASQGYREILQLVHRIGKIGHWEWNSSTDENKWSPEIEALYGLKPGTFGGSYEAWAKLLHPDDLPQQEEVVRRAFETGQYLTEFRVIWPDGSVHWLEARGSVLKDDHGKPVRFTGVNMDVTERKQVEERLREQAELLDLAHDAIIVRSTKGVITFWSHGAEQMYGWAKEAALGKATHTLLQTKFPRPLPEIEVELAERGWWEGTLTHTRQDGVCIVVASRWVMRRKPGKQSIVLEINTEITEQRKAEEERDSLLLRLTSLVDNTPLAVVEWDADFVVTRWSGQAEKMFGWVAAEIVGKRIDATRLVHEEDVPKVNAAMARLLSPTNKYVVCHNRNNTKAGGVISCEWYNSTLHDEAGRMKAILSLVLDVTERERAEEALMDADHRKDEFLATLAHELRNPLAPVRNSLEVMKRARGNSDLIE